MKNSAVTAAEQIPSRSSPFCVPAAVIGGHRQTTPHMINRYAANSMLYFRFGHAETSLTIAHAALLE